MAIYKQGKYYRYDFIYKGNRFYGSCETANKKEAHSVEKDAREKAKAQLAASNGKGPLLFRDAANRFYQEVGQHHANSDTTWRDLKRLVEYFGEHKVMDHITDAEIATLVAWRRSHTIKGRKKDKNGKPVALVSPATVNRSTVVLLKTVFNRAKRTWRYSYPDEPNWRDHKLKEPQERVRELDQSEAAALDAAVRDDYALWFEFARLTGLRRNETLIRWKNVNLTAKRITTIGKGDKTVTTPITPAIQGILDQCKGHHPEWVFTYVCKRPRIGQVKGQRYPITSEGVKSQWRRLRKRANVEDFRFHDIRHDVATKLLRHTGNLKLVQRALNHSNITTTTKYAHVMDDELAAALHEIASPREIPTNNPTTEIKKVS